LRLRHRTLLNFVRGLPRDVAWHDGVAGTKSRAADRSGVGATGGALGCCAGEELLEDAEGLSDFPRSSGRIARYAWGDDYHDVIEKKLRILDEWLAARGGRQRHYVDTGPVLERDFAAIGRCRLAREVNDAHSIRSWAPGSFSPKFSRRSNWNLIHHSLIVADAARAVSTRVRRPRSPDRINWMRGVAFRTSRSNTKAASRSNSAR
jgi:hypothetical protein